MQQAPVRGSVEDIAERQRLFNELVMPYKNMIYKLCIRYTMKGGERVEENYNDVLTNLYQYINTYNPEMSIKTWLHIVTKRHIAQIDSAKKCTVVSGRGDKSDIIQVDIEMIDEESDDDDPKWQQVSAYSQVDNEKMLMDCIGDDLKWALEELSPMYRQLILMHYDGMSHKEIACTLYAKGEMSKPCSKIVKSKMNAARQKLKKMIKRNGERIV